MGHAGGGAGARRRDTPQSPHEWTSAAPRRDHSLGRLRPVPSAGAALIHSSRVQLRPASVPCRGGNYSMYRDLAIAVVVPAYNEARLIGKTISTVPSFVDHIVVVDDCSTDGTSGAALAVGDPRVTLIRHERNTGVGGAILDGHRRVLGLAADVSVVMAGDAQMDPDYLPDLLDPIADGEADFTKANRFFSRTSFCGMPRHRVFGSIVLSFMTKAASGYWHLFDPQNGYTATTAAILRRISLDHVATGYEFENDFLIRLNIADARARDVPVPAVYGQEVSGIRLHKVAPVLFGLLFRGFWRRILVKHVLQSFSPVALLLFSGLALFGFGAA